VTGPDVALELDNLVMHFGAVQAVDGVSLSIRAGQASRPSAAASCAC